MGLGKIFALSALLCVSADFAIAKSTQCTVKYKAPGSISTWTTPAQSSYDAVAKWEKTIKKGRSGYSIIDVKCK